MSVLSSVKNPTPYWQKYDKIDLSDFEWNIPDQSSGDLLIIGGNAQNFALAIKIGEYLSGRYPLKNLRLLFPDSLATKLPKDPRFIFAPSTPSGSLADADTIKTAADTADATLVIGDLSKNPITAESIAQALLAESEHSVLLTRDAVDLIADKIIDHPKLILIATMSQLQNLFRSIYYPKVLLLSMPILPVIEALHKFTLSYPTQILTFHQGQIILAHAGKVASVPISATSYNPLSLWQGQLAANYLALSLYNPGGLLA